MLQMSIGAFDRKKCISNLQPDSTDPSMSCDTGHIWDEITKKCQIKLKSEHDCEKGKNGIF